MRIMILLSMLEESLMLTNQLKSSRLWEFLRQKSVVILVECILFTIQTDDWTLTIWILIESIDSKGIWGPLSQTRTKSQTRMKRKWARLSQEREVHCFCYVFIFSLFLFFFKHGAFVIIFPYCDIFLLYSCFSLLWNILLLIWLCDSPLAFNESFHESLEWLILWLTNHYTSYR